MPELTLLSLYQRPILEQLHLEESLLRQSGENFCLIGQRAPPAVVMGISAKQELVVRKECPLPLIRRFTGGGTVVIDEETLFITFILNHKEVGIKAQPLALMQWTAKVYEKVFAHPLFALRENDYVFGEKKCGGNAQYLSKERALHHTSFLWSFDPGKMHYLLFPPKTPAYRKGRAHEEFLHPLREVFSSKEDFILRLKEVLNSHFTLKEQTEAPLLESSCRRSSQLCLP